MRLLISNIKQLLQVEDEPRKMVRGNEMSNIETLEDAFVLVEDGIISDFGTMARFSASGLSNQRFDAEISATERTVLPAFCDSHTHLVYPASREIEYVDKIKGLSYEEIAKRGGGILNSARLLRSTSEEKLFDDAMGRLELIRSYGTGAVEIKSGYGLSTESEIKMLRVIRKLKEKSPLRIRSTFLGAHACPEEFKGRQDDYVDLIVREMLPMVAGEGLADYVDVFCDQGFFTVEQTDRILEEGVKLGLTPKIHANELARSGGVQVGVKHGALSVDHLEHMEQEEIDVLLGSGTMPALLPTAALFLGLTPPPARRMIDSGLPVALASDYNPGSSPTGNMQLVLSLASIMLRMTPEEGINAATLNGAYAMGLERELGSIAKGKAANLIITRQIPTYHYIPYTMGDNNIQHTMLDGKIN